jgi:hypothetical protein
LRFKYRRSLDVFGDIFFILFQRDGILGHLAQQITDVFPDKPDVVDNVVYSQVYHH